MSRSIVGCPEVVISSGQTESAWVDSAKVYDDALSITLYGPAGLDALTFTIEVSPDGSTAYALQDGGAAVEAPGASEAIVLDNPSFRYFRIKASGAVAADRAWQMDKEIYI